MIERVHGEARGQRLEIADPVLRRSHASVKEDEIRATAAAVDRHARDHWAVQPPSITSSLPVTNADSSDAR